MEPNYHPPIGWTPGQVAAATLTVAAVAAGAFLLYWFQAALFCLFVGIVISSVLKRPVEWLERLGFQHAQAVVSVYIVLALLLLVVAGAGIPWLAKQVSDLGSALPALYTETRERLVESPSELLRRAAAQLPQSPPWIAANPAKGATEKNSGDENPPADQSQNQATTETTHLALGFLGNALPGILACVAALLLAFYWSLQEERTIRSLLLLVRGPRRAEWRTLIAAIQAKVGTFVFGQSILCCLIGLLTLGAYLLIGLPHALPLALAAGLLEAIPVFGLLAAGAPAVLVAGSQGAGAVVGVVVALILIHLTDNMFLSPRIMGRVVGVHPVVTLLAVTGFGALFGLPGAILAILMASIIQLLADRFLLSRDAHAASSLPGRDQLNLLRHEAQELLLDVRGKLRHEAQELLLDVRGKLRDSEATPLDADEHVEESIELIARDLDRLLCEAASERGGAGAGVAGNNWRREEWQ